MQRLTMSKLVAAILIFLLINNHPNDAEGRDVEDPLRQQNKTNQPSLYKIPETMVLLKNKTYVNVTRKPRFLSGLSFLTGLGLGSIAGAAALNDPALLTVANYNIIPRLSTSTTTTTTTMATPPTNLDLNINSSDFFPLARVPEANIHSSNYPYVLALSTNVLVNKTLRSVHQALQELQAQFERKQIVDDVDDVENEEPNNLSMYRNKDDYVVVNCTTLRDIVRASIAEQTAKDNQNFFKQAKPVVPSNTPTEPPQTDETTVQYSTTPATDTTTTMVTTTPSNLPLIQPQFDGYYYGSQSSNISGVDITSEIYAPPAQQIYSLYPPVFGSISFYPDHRPDHYETYHGASSGFNGISESYPHYENYGRSRKFPSARESKDSKGFILTKI
uniref:Uncharacterized protein n=1 Tax=Fopius arisanus TaxID=64838 RepID=A0A0C9RA23_9HYME